MDQRGSVVYPDNLHLRARTLVSRHPTQGILYSPTIPKLSGWHILNTWRNFAAISLTGSGICGLEAPFEY